MAIANRSKSVTIPDEKRLSLQLLQVVAHTTELVIKPVDEEGRVLIKEHHTLTHRDQLINRRQITLPSHFVHVLRERLKIAICSASDVAKSKWIQNSSSIELIISSIPKGGNAFPGKSAPNLIIAAQRLNLLQVEFNREGSL